VEPGEHLPYHSSLMLDQLDPLAAHLQGVPVGEGHLRRRPGRVAVAQQEPPDLDDSGR